MPSGRRARPKRSPDDSRAAQAIALGGERRDTGFHMTSSLTLTRFACFALVSASTLFSAQAALAANPTVIIEQKSEIDAIGSWTVSMPNQTTAGRTDATMTMADAQPGKYTIFATAPRGTNTSIELYENGVLTQSLGQPQVSFTAAPDMTVKVVISYTLVNFGKVGINSVPSGIPFQLTGPDGLRRKGQTPAEFDRLPVGPYSVQYTPEGCVLPPAKSDVLEKDKGVYFSLTIRCETFVPAETEDASAHAQATVDGETVTYTDVPVRSWFGPFVATVSGRGILTGYRDAAGKLTGQFGPENPVTVGELTKIMHQLAGLNEHEMGGELHNRSALGKWFMPFVQSAEERGWAIYQNDQADLLRPATRGEVLVTLLQVLDLPLTWPRGIMFTDVTLRTPFAHAIETAATAGIVSGATGDDGSPTGFFNPTQPVTRAEMAKIIIIVQEKYREKFNLD